MAGKKYKKAIEGYDRIKKYTVADGCALISKAKISSVLVPVGSGLEISRFD